VRHPSTTNYLQYRIHHSFVASAFESDGGAGNGRIHHPRFKGRASSILGISGLSLRYSRVRNG
jgi:hypothetical protein